MQKVHSSLFLLQVRSILLRGFDQQMADKIGVFMEKNGVKFIRGAVPKSIEQVRDIISPYSTWVHLYTGLYGILVCMYVCMVCT